MSRYYYQPGFSVESTDIFSSVFSIEIEDGKEHYPVQVKLKSNAIDFSYVKFDKEHPIHPEVAIPWFSVDLEESDHTDFFLQHAHDFEKKVFVDKNSDFHIHYFWGLENKEFLKNEPFIKSLSVRHVLLCLFEDLNNPSGDFRKYSPEMTNAVLTKLSKSTVYKLIWRKYSFYRELYDYEASKHPEYYNRLKVLYAKYLTLLLKDVYYENIPYKTLQENDFWLQNPECELDKLAEINKKHRIDDDSLTQVQNYFLKRHAVLNALKINAGSLFIPIIATSALAGLLFLINWICWLNGIFKHTTWIWGAGTFFFVSSLAMLAAKKNFINMIMPRIFVAILSVLFVIVGTEELFTRMIDVNASGVAITVALCLTVLIFFLLSESRQHSPAYKPSLHRMYDIKITPILFHAFNFANVLVLGLQLVIMPQIVDRSDYIKSDIFADKLCEIEYTLKDFEDFSKNVTELDRYHNSLLSIENTKTSGISSITVNDSIKTSLHLNLGNYIPTLKQLREKNKEYKERLELNRYVYLKTKHLKPMIDKRLETTEKSYEGKLESVIDSIQFTIKKGRALEDLHSQLTQYYREMQQDSILKELCTYQPNTTKILTTLPYSSHFSKVYKLTYNPKKVIIIKPLKNDCFSIKLFKNDDKILLYPTLMMMQICISLLFGIVGQLIISDKTVTEAL